jgi:hypothetical protein
MAKALRWCDEISGSEDRAGTSQLNGVENRREELFGTRRKKLAPSAAPLFTFLRK